MQPDQIAALRRQYTDQYVVVDPGQPELARFAGLVGQIRTVNMTGRALVQFQGEDRGWYDIGVDFLKIVDKPAPPPPAKKEPAAKKDAPAT